MQKHVRRISGLTNRIQAVCQLNYNPYWCGYGWHINYGPENKNKYVAYIPFETLTFVFNSNIHGIIMKSYCVSNNTKMQVVNWKITARDRLF